MYSSRTANHSRKAQERVLFFSLWIILLLGIALWRFWPSHQVGAVVPPRLILSADLQRLFARAEITQAPPTRYKLRLSLHDQYRKDMGAEKQQLHIAYRFMGTQSPVEEGSVPCRMSSKNPSVEIELPNPRRWQPIAIQLFLAQ